LKSLVKSLKSPIPALRAVEKKSRIGCCSCFGKENASALIKALEKEAGVEVEGALRELIDVPYRTAIMSDDIKLRLCRAEDDCCYAIPIGITRGLEFWQSASTRR